MAFTNFYLIAAGSGSADINAGSTIGAAQVTTTNGSWNSGTGVFIAASGTPFAATTTSDYAAVYVDGATVTTFVGKVTTVTSSTQITVDVATIKYGTAPSTNATARSCTINGSWNTEQVLAAGGLATTTVPQSTKINIKGDLTVTASRTISMAGAATTPLWFSGYNTTPGDLDNDTTNSLAKPTWTFNATFQLTTSGANQLWTSVSVTGSRSGVQWNASGSTWSGLRLRVENTSSNAAAFALQLAASSRLSFSYCKSPATATTTGVVSSASRCQYNGCVFDTGGNAAINQSSNGDCLVVSCVFLNNVSGIVLSTGGAYIYNSTFYNASSDAVKWTGAPSTNNPNIVQGCLFNICGATAINNASGTNANNVFRSNNDFYSCSTNEAGFGDMPAFFQQTDSNSVVTSATDMTPGSNSAAINNGFPGIFEKQSYSSYPAIGAVEPLASGGSAVAIFGS